MRSTCTERPRPTDWAAVSVTGVNFCEEERDDTPAWAGRVVLSSTYGRCPANVRTEGAQPRKWRARPRPGRRRPPVVDGPPVSRCLSRFPVRWSQTLQPRRPRTGPRYWAPGPVATEINDACRQVRRPQYGCPVGVAMHHDRRHDRSRRTSSASRRTFLCRANATMGCTRVDVARAAMTFVPGTTTLGARTMRTGST